MNSQSGKAGSAWLLETEHHVRLPRAMEVEFSQMVQKEADTSGNEITSAKIWTLYEEAYLNLNSPFELVSFNSAPEGRDSNQERVFASVKHDGKIVEFEAVGNGPISAFVEGMRATFDLQFKLADFGQNTRSSTSQAEAAAYVELKVPNDEGKSVFGAGIDTSITQAPIRALISALNKIKA